MSTLPRPLPPLAPDAHKGDAGRVLAICGSEWYPGAAILVARAAQRAGAGLVTLGCVDAKLAQIVPAAAPEAVYLDLREASDAPELELQGRSDDVRAMGPGLGWSGRTRALVRGLLRDDYEGGCVLDADALNVLEGELELVATARGPVILTPHPGEAARLLGVESIPRDEAGRGETAREIARRARAVCCLKGRRTVVTDGERVHVNATGNAGMASAGMGDVLTGIAAAYLARAVRAGRADFGAFEAAVLAVHVHGAAGDLAAAELGRSATVASSLIERLGAAQRELTE